MSTEKDNEIRASGLKLVNLQSDESISNYFRESLLLRKRGDKDKSLWKWFLASANNAVGKTRSEERRVGKEC